MGLDDGALAAYRGTMGRDQPELLQSVVTRSVVQGRAEAIAWRAIQRAATIRAVAALSHEGPGSLWRVVEHRLGSPGEDQHPHDPTLAGTARHAC